jgi:flagellar basal-body rod protein FlgB
MLPPQELFPEHLFEARVAERQPGITFQDANNRSIEHQFLEMTKNSLLQNFALQIMTAQYGQLHAAITGQA